LDTQRDPSLSRLRLEIDVWLGQNQQVSDVVGRADRRHPHFTDDKDAGYALIPQGCSATDTLIVTVPGTIGGVL
jgi:hypothetical protein